MQGLRQYWWNLFVNGFLMSYLVPVGFRRFILNFMGAKIKGVLHGHSAILTTKLQLAEGSFINRNCFIDNNAMITIGRNCSIGYKVTLILPIIQWNAVINGEGKTSPHRLIFMMAVG